MTCPPAIAVAAAAAPAIVAPCKTSRRVVTRWWCPTVALLRTRCVWTPPGDVAFLARRAPDQIMTSRHPQRSARNRVTTPRRPGDSCAAYASITRAEYTNADPGFTA